jgi:hypothetical protein
MVVKNSDKKNRHKHCAVGLEKYYLEDIQHTLFPSADISNNNHAMQRGDQLK